MSLRARAARIAAVAVLLWSPASPAPPPSNVAPAGGQQAAHQRGYKEAMGCVSQNAGNACTASTTAQDSLACMQSYQAGYAAAVGFRDSLLQGVETSGRLDKQNGQGRGATPINPQLDAGCRIESLQAYNRGYGL